MERIAIAGVTLHGTDVSGLERIRRPAAGEENGFVRKLSDELGASELVFLATCNRVEVVYAREEGELPDENDLAVLARELVQGDPEPELLRLHTGREAVHHLFRVASSLDSLVLGEDQIIAQVRDAYGRAADNGLVGPLLGPLFHSALQVGKKVRSETDLARHPVSVVNLAVQKLQERPEADTLTVAVVGAGEMGSLLARALRTAGLGPSLVVNRSRGPAERLATEVDARAIDLATFRRGEHEADVLVTATASTGLLLSIDELRDLATRTPHGGPLLGIDLSVPRNLPGADEPGLQVVDLDALRSIADSNRSKRADAAAVAEQMVQRKVEVFVRRFREDVAAPVVTELRQASEEILGRELQGLLTGRLAHLPEKDRRAVERWARATFGRLLHPSVSAVKRMAWEIGDGKEPRRPEHEIA